MVPAWSVALTGRRPLAASSMTMVGTGELAVSTTGSSVEKRR